MTAGAGKQATLVFRRQWRTAVADPGPSFVLPMMPSLLMLVVFTSLFDFAVLTGAPVVGAVIDWSGYAVAFGGLGVFIGAGLVVYVIWDRAIAGAARVAAELG